jgi:hypothetical protein
VLHFFLRSASPAPLSTGDLNLKNVSWPISIVGTNSRTTGTSTSIDRVLIEAMASNDKVREMRAGDTTKCANDVCTKPGEHLCSRCRAVKYCSASCQKVHWKQGGHKQACSADRLTASVASLVAAAASARAGSEVGECIVCLGNDPMLIQSGCACRGDAGLAHVECRADAASHRMANTKILDLWTRCATCGQPFTGAMQLGLAAAWWSTAQCLPEKNDQRMAAANNLASALAAQGKHEEAETMFRLLLATVRRVRGPEHERTLSATMNLANVLDSQGKHVEAETTYRDLLTVQRRVMGPEHPNTLLIAINLARGLQARGKNAEAETLYRDTLPVQRRVLGPEHPDTLRTAGNLASALGARGEFAEAETMLRETLAVQNRVLGSEHPNTLLTASNMGICSRAARGVPRSSAR